MGEAVFFALAVTALAVFGFGAFGFLVGPALLDFFAFDGVLGLTGDLEAALAFFSGADAAFLAFDTATLFFSAAVFLDLAEAAGAAFLPAFEADPFSADVGADATERLATPVFLDFADDDAVAAADLFFVADGALAAPVTAEANLNEPEAPFPLVWTNEPDATAPLRYFLMKGANFSASTL